MRLRITMDSGKCYILTCPEEKTFSGALHGLMKDVEAGDRDVLEFPDKAIFVSKIQSIEEVKA